VRRRSLPPARFSEHDLATFDPRRKVAKGQSPLLIIHGEKDRSISADEAREAFQLATTTRKQLVIISGRGHNDVSAAPEYWQALAHVWTWRAFAKP
jgi:pimeloyl-ACP methyl ester carboxylesterase